MLRKVETEPFPGGFRRRWPGPPWRLPASRDTSMVREVLWRGGSRLVDAACVFGGWVHVMAMAEAGWLGPPRASERNSLVEAGERLASMAASVRTVQELTKCAPGSVAFVLGRVARPGGGTQQDPLWQYQESKYQLEEFFRAEDPWPLPEEPNFVETAYDFVLHDGSYAHALVHVDGAYLVGASRLTVGSRVGVLGFVDSVVDPAGEVHGTRILPTVPALRSGGPLPLLVLVQEEVPGT